MFLRRLLDNLVYHWRHVTINVRHIAHISYVPYLTYGIILTLAHYYPSHRNKILIYGFGSIIGLQCYLNVIFSQCIRISFDIYHQTNLQTTNNTNKIEEISEQLKKMGVETKSVEDAN